MTKMVFLWYGILKEENRMRKSIFQKMSAVFLSMTLVVGMAASVPADQRYFPGGFNLRVCN